MLGNASANLLFVRAFSIFVIPARSQRLCAALMSQREHRWFVFFFFPIALLSEELELLFPGVA